MICHLPLKNLRQKIPVTSCHSMPHPQASSKLRLLVLVMLLAMAYDIGKAMVLITGRSQNKLFSGVKGGH